MESIFDLETGAVLAVLMLLFRTPLLAANRGVDSETVRRCLYFPLMKASRVW